ncbi:MAG TPA: hypothetical protein QGH10_20285 [Armatimonadota bacterium]|nr:hypothetical protein [Armatimonadota bacterium]
MNRHPHVAGILRSTLAPVAALSIAALTGCPSSPPPAQVRTGAGTSTDAVVRDTVTVLTEAGDTRYESDGWALTVGADEGWTIQPDSGSTLRLTRDGPGARSTLTLRAYHIRDGMPMITFLASIALWRVEEDLPRVEPTHDEDLRTWRGYTMDDDGETYFGFWTAGDRGYVLEAAAVEGVLSADAVAEFEEIASRFECRPRHSTEGTESP